MKSHFAFLIFAIGTLLCTISAEPDSSEIQQLDEDDSTKVEKLLDQLDRAARSQQDDDNFDDTSALLQAIDRAAKSQNSVAKAQFFGSVFRILKGVAGPIIRGIGGLLRGGQRQIPARRPAPRRRYVPRQNSQRRGVRRPVRRRYYGKRGPRRTTNRRRG